jgi:polyferredoxin
MVSMAEKNMAKKNSRKPAKFARWRWLVQTGFLVAWLDPLAMRMHNVCGPVFHCYSCPLAMFACPIGVLANFSALHVFPFAAVGMLVVLGAAFGSFICGWACPFGFLQDLIAKVPTPKFTLPLWMGGLRYVVLLALVLVIPYLWGEKHPLFFCSVCPAGAIEGSLTRLILPSATKIAITLLIVLAMFFTWRPWCMLFCPLGAIYSLFNYVSVLFLRFHRDLCIDCADCRSLCVDGGPAERRVDGLHCVRCADCTRCRAVTVETVFSLPDKPVAVDKSPPTDTIKTV